VFSSARYDRVGILGVVVLTHINALGAGIGLELIAHVRKDWQDFIRLGTVEYDRGSCQSG
jgi:hypothetical protein